MSSEPATPTAAPLKRAIALSGGGARGAYEVGVLNYLLRELPRELITTGKIRVLTGNSVGSINACFVAANAQVPDCNIERLKQIWSALSLEQLLRLNAWDVIRVPFDLRALFQKDPDATGVVLNYRALERIVVRETAWRQIQRNLAAGHLDALAVSATHITSGRTTVFVNSHDGRVPPWSRDRRMAARAVTIGPVHALASAAIPFVFPPILIDGTYYCDGGIRQSTPLAPALRLGADRVLVVPLWHEQHGARPVDAVPAEGEEEPFPSAILMLGKLLNALLLDRLDYDLSRLEGFNAIIRDGKEAYGDAFLQHLAKTSKRMRGVPYREVDAVIVRPSQDIGQMAREFVEEFADTMGLVPRWLLRKMAASSAAIGEADLLSYLLFDGRFAERLMQLGMHDADAVRDRLIAFMGD